MLGSRNVVIFFLWFLQFFKLFVSSVKMETALLKGSFPGLKRVAFLKKIMSKGTFDFIWFTFTLVLISGMWMLRFQFLSFPEMWSLVPRRFWCKVCFNGEKTWICQRVQLKKYTQDHFFSSSIYKQFIEVKAFPK